MSPAKEYFISFDTNEMPGRILAVRVTLGHEVVKDMDAEMRIDLRNHPLYAQLESYVHSNPSRERKQACSK